MMKIFNMLVFVMILAGTAFADLGPKPQMDFKIAYKTSQPVSIVDAKLLQCQDSLCLQNAPLENLGPQNFSCTDIIEGGQAIGGTCHSMAYGYAPYQKLVITFSDKVRESNIFQQRNFREEYHVDVLDEKMIVGFADENH
jgi:hypothetical protein